MKLKGFLVVAATVLFASCGSPYRATDTSTVAITAPSGVESSFMAQYPTATDATWYNYDAAMVPIDWDLTGWPTLDNGDYLVRFNMSDENYYAWYDESGNWVGTVYSVKDYNSLPGPVTTMLNNQFPGYNISSLNREFQKDKMLYEIELKNSDTKVKLVTDGYGNIVKQKTKAK
jgi:hypothetical protein